MKITTRIVHNSKRINTNKEKRMETTEQRRKRLTSAFIHRIAKIRIEQCGLKDTPDEYIKKCEENTRKISIENNRKTRKA